MRRGFAGHGSRCARNALSMEELSTFVLLFFTAVTERKEREAAMVMGGGGKAER